MSDKNVLRRWVEALKQGVQFDLASGDALIFTPRVDNQGSIEFGDGATDLDLKIFLGATTAHVVFDVSAGKIVMTGAEIDMNGNELILDADADTSITADTDDQIDFKVGGTDLMVLDADGLTAVGIRPTSETAAAIAAARTLTAADSGGIFTVAKTGVYTITLPTPAQGLNFKFLILDTGANIVTILADGAFCLGMLTEAGATPTAMTGTTILATSGQVAGDWLQIEGIDSTHWLVTGSTLVAASFTIS